MSNEKSAQSGATASAPLITEQNQNYPPPPQPQQQHYSGQQQYSQPQQQHYSGQQQYSQPQGPPPSYQNASSFPPLYTSDAYYAQNFNDKSIRRGELPSIIYSSRLHELWIVETSTGSILYANHFS